MAAGVIEAAERVRDALNEGLVLPVLREDVTALVLYVLVPR
jgi:hypothetical protein